MRGAQATRQPQSDRDRDQGQREKGRVPGVGDAPCGPELIQHHARPGLGARREPPGLRSGRQLSAQRLQEDFAGLPQGGLVLARTLHDVKGLTHQAQVDALLVRRLQGVFNPFGNARLAGVVGDQGDGLLDQHRRLIALHLVRPGDAGHREEEQSNCRVCHAGRTPGGDEETGPLPHDYSRAEWGLTHDDRLSGRQGHSPRLTCTSRVWVIRGGFPVADPPSYLAVHPSEYTAAKTARAWPVDAGEPWAVPSVLSGHSTGQSSRQPSLMSRFLASSATSASATTS